VRRLAALSKQLCDAGAGDDAAFLARSTGLSAAGMRAAWEVTFAPWTESAIRELLQAENWQEEVVNRDGLQVPQHLAHILAGNVLPPTWSVLMRGWILGASQWLRPSAREPLFAATVLRRVAAIEPVLAAMTTVAWWPHLPSGLDPMARVVLEHADVVTAHGDDHTVSRIEASLQQLPVSPRFVGYGSRWSCAVLGAEDLTVATAQGVALDVALFDQQGCLSPTRVFIRADAPSELWCGWLAQALAAMQQQMPRGEPGDRGRAALRHWLERMRLAKVQGHVRRMWAAPTGTAWSVVLSQACEDWLSPLDRHVLVLPVTGAMELRRQLGSQLDAVQGVAVHSVESTEPWRREILQALRPSRMAPVGTLQCAPPAWSQDHRPPLRSLLLDWDSDS
jgi:hypothetical protein